MEFHTITSISSLSAAQQTMLERGKIATVTDLLLTSPRDIAQRCNILQSQAEAIVGLVAASIYKAPQMLADLEDDEVFSTGDTGLDKMLDGGIKTGMIWEVVGESAAGKTQLALQLSLLVQTSRENGGLAGSACYLTTSSTLPTTRLLEITNTHPRLSPTLCSLSNIYTIKTPEVAVLTQVLTQTLPDLITQLASKSGAKPIKLLVIDALTELFHSENKVTGDTLFERSRSLSEISTLLHMIANKYCIAVLVLNEVVDVIDRHYGVDMDDSSDVIYREQARWFNQAESIVGQGIKQASLGLVWANQVNTRIMLSRTARMQYLDDTEERPVKRRRVTTMQEGVNLDVQSAVIRRFSIVFSSVVPRMSMDYIVTDQGIMTISDTVERGSLPTQSNLPRRTSVLHSKTDEADRISQLDVGVITTGADAAVGKWELAHGNNGDRAVDADNGPQPGEDEEVNSEDGYWLGLDSEPEFYCNVDLSSSAPNQL